MCLDTCQKCGFTCISEGSRKARGRLAEGSRKGEAEDCFMNKAHEYMYVVLCMLFYAVLCYVM